MAKIKLREACFKGIENTQTKQQVITQEHKVLVKKANRKIAENHVRYAIAYRNAGTYLSK